MKETFFIGKKDEMRPSVDLTNEAQYVGIHEVSLECAERKSGINRPDLVWSFHHNYNIIIIIIVKFIFTQNMVFVHNFRHAVATLLK